MKTKVFKLDDYDWWAGESLVACIAEARAQCGAGSYCDSEEDGREVSTEELQTLKYIDEDDAERTFAEQLAIEVAERGDGSKPWLFASTEF